MRPDTLVPLGLVLPPMLVALLAEPAAWTVLALTDALGPGWYGRGSLLAAVHLLTLGTLGASILGAGWQLVAVVTARPHPPAVQRAAPWVNGAVLAGMGLLVAGMVRPGVVGGVGAGLLVAGLLVRSALVAWALSRGTGRRVVRGWLLAAEACLVAGATVGALLWSGRVGVPVIDPITGIALHARLLLAGWIGGWIVGVGALLVPMFAVGPEPPPWGLAVAGVAFFAGVVTGEPLLGGVGAALSALLLLGGIARRVRPALGPELVLVGAGLAVLPALPWLDAVPAVAAALALFALPILRGMQQRILPFLAWAHAFAGDPGSAPSVGALVPRAASMGGAVLGLGGGLLLVSGVVTEAWIPARLGAGALLAASVLQVAVVAGVGWRTWRARLRATALPGMEAT